MGTSASRATSKAPVFGGTQLLNLDTHVLIRALAGELNERERSLLGEHTWSISAIVLWELAELVQLERVELDLENAEVARTISARTPGHWTWRYVPSRSSWTSRPIPPTS